MTIHISRAKKTATKRTPAQRVSVTHKDGTRNAILHWVPFAFSVLLVVGSYQKSNVSDTTTLKQQVTTIQAHQLEQDTRIDKSKSDTDSRMEKIDAVQLKMGKDFVPRPELTGLLQDINKTVDKLDNKVDLLLANQHSRNER